jgi:hypothetical protein
MDAVQWGYGVLVPERMVEWEDGGRTVAWWQLDPDTGETIGVGEDGTHQMLIQGLAGFLLTVAIILLVIALVVWLLRMLIWRIVASMTWKYFWKTALPDASSGAGAGMTQEEIYKQALQDTKRHMKKLRWLVTPFYW